MKKNNGSYFRENNDSFPREEEQDVFVNAKNKKNNKVGERFDIFEDDELLEYAKIKEKGKNRRANKYKDKEKNKYIMYDDWE